MPQSDFAIRVEALLKERNLTRADLGRGTDIPYHRLNPWFIRAKAKPSGPDLTKVARYFGVSEVWLINGGERRPFDERESLIARIEQLNTDGRAQMENFLTFLLERQAQDPASDPAPEEER